MLSRRDFLKLSGATLLAAALSNIDMAGADESTPAPLIYHGSRRHRYIALTYDDCYLLRRMQDLEKLLDEYPEIKITLFPVGVAILNLERQDAGIWKRFRDKGHEIGYHTFDHTDLSTMSTATALMDYDQWYAALTQVLGDPYPVHFVRPPYDIVSHTLDVLCRERGLVAVLYSIGGGGETENVMNALKMGKNGDIVQMHIRTQDYKTSVEAYPWLRENNWDAVTLSKLYDDLLLEQNNSEGCDVGAGSALTRTCIE